MKFMIPLLLAVLPQHPSRSRSPGPPQACRALLYPKPPKYWSFRPPKKGVTAPQIMDVIPAEIRATVRLYLDGKIREWYSRGDGKGVIFLVDAKTEDEARAIMETLPLAKEQLMESEYIPVGPLMPLRALMGSGTQQ